QAYKVSERVLLPTMIVLDAFVLSHTYEVVDIPEQEKVDEYLPPYNPPYRLDPDEPHAFGGLTGPDGYFELRYIIEKAMEESREVWRETGKEFGEVFGREYGLTEEYKTGDAEFLIVASATIASTARVAVDVMREKGKKVGLLRIRVIRPFPFDEVRECLKGRKKVLVIDRNVSFGFGGIFYQEVKSAMYNEEHRPPIFGIITGLGGRDVRVEDIMEMVEDVERREKPEDIIWKGVRV
ncbi:pyruvate ferredoxin oxidoreductase, partial [bacterium]